MILTDKQFGYIIFDMKEKYNESALEEQYASFKQRGEKMKLINKIQYLVSYFNEDLKQATNCIIRNKALKDSFFLDFDNKVIDYQNYCLREMNTQITKALEPCERAIMQVHNKIDAISYETIKNVHDKAYMTYRYSQLVILKINKLEDFSEFLGGQTEDFEDDLIRENVFAQTLGFDDFYIKRHKQMLNDVFDDDKITINHLLLTTDNTKRER